MIAEIILFAEGFNNTKVSFMALKIFLFKKNPQFSLLIAFSVNKLVSFFLESLAEDTSGASADSFVFERKKVIKEHRIAFCLLCRTITPGRSQKYVFPSNTLLGLLSSESFFLSIYVGLYEFGWQN